MISHLYVQANVRKRVSCMIIYRHTHVYIYNKYYCVILYFVCLLSVFVYCVCFLSTIIWLIKMNILKVDKQSKDVVA